MLNLCAEICDRRQDLPALLLHVDSNLINLFIQFDDHSPKPRWGWESAYASEVGACVDYSFNPVCFKLLLYYFIVFGFYLQLSDQPLSNMPIYFLEMLVRH